MKLYCLYHSVRVRCPGCGVRDHRMHVYAETVQEAATSEEALCRSCVQTMGEMPKLVHISHPWYGVDLDRTLAKTVEPFDIMQIGEPIPAMIERVHQMLSEGKDVRIFTARVAGSNAYSPLSQRFDDAAFAAQQLMLIREWCLIHLDTILPVTATKDFACVEIYDDRAKQVVPETGVLIEDLYQETLRKPQYVIRGVDKIPFGEDDLTEGG